MEKGIELGDLFGEVENGKRSLASLKLEAFDLSTDPCLPRAKYTSHSNSNLQCI